MYASGAVLSGVIVILCAAGFAARCAGAGDAGEVPPSKASEGKPLQVFSWEEPPPGVENTTGFIWVDLSDDPKARHPRALPPEEAAQASRRRPKGCAALFIWKGHDVLGHPEDCARTADGQLTKFHSIWLDHGVAQVKARVTRFFTDFKKAGGKLDCLVLDYEGGLSNWCLKPEQAAAIFADPRAAELKARLGFDSGGMFKDCSPPPYNLGDDLAAAVAQGDKPYMKWNRTVYSMLCAALNEAVFAPVHELFPKARASNYGMATVSADNFVLDTNGHIETHALGFFGNRGSREFYGYRQFKSRKLQGGQEYGQEPLAVLRWMVNTMRAYRRSSNVPFSPWVSHKSWTGDAAFDFRFADNDYYQEMVYHLALMDADDILYWNPAPWMPSQTLKEMRKEGDDLLLDTCVRILNRKFGDKPRRCITLQDLPWDSALIVTGTQLGEDRVLWRITVPRWDSRVKVTPAGKVLTTDKFLGLWHETAPGENVSFELLKTGK